jgi:hypothetical protein
MSVEKDSFLERLDAAWRQWNDAYTGSLHKTGMIENRALKDIIAHVTWAVLETNGMLRAQDLVGSELWRLPEDERNEVVFQENKDRHLTEIVDEAEAAHQTLVGLVAGISENDLLNASWFAALPGNFPPWRVIQVNVIDHYQYHVQDVLSLDG